MGTVGVVVGIVLFLAIIGAGIWLVWFAWSSSGSTGARVVAGVSGCAIMSLVGLGIPVAILYPVFLGAREAATRTACVANMNNIGKAFLMYAGDNNKRMPLRGWCDAISGYVGDRSTYACPEFRDPYGYTLHTKMPGLDTTTVNRGTTIAAFDGLGGKDSVGDFSQMAFRHRGNVAVIGYVDGHVRAESKETFRPR